MFCKFTTNKILRRISSPLMVWPLMMAVQPDRTDVYTEINTSCRKTYQSHQQAKDQGWLNELKGLVLVSRHKNF